MISINSLAFEASIKHRNGDSFSYRKVLPVELIVLEIPNHNKINESRQKRKKGDEAKINSYYSDPPPLPYIMICKKKE